MHQILNKKWTIMNHLKNLETLLNNLTIHSNKFNNEMQTDLNIIKQRYNFYKSKFLQTFRNQHYVNCIWYNDQQFMYVMPKDYCSCHYIERFPQQLCNEIVERFGLEYMKMLI